MSRLLALSPCRMQWEWRDRDVRDSGGDDGGLAQYEVDDFLALETLPEEADAAVLLEERPHGRRRPANPLGLTAYFFFEF